MLKDLEKQFRSLPSEFPAAHILNYVHGTVGRVGTKTVSLFCTDDFLGMAQDPRRHAKVISAIEQFGVGTAGTLATGGARPFHRQLELRLLEFCEQEDAVLFQSVSAGLSTFLSVLLEEYDFVLCDQMSQPAVINACSTARGRVVIFPHHDLAFVERLLTQNTQARRKLIVIESLNGSTGLIAPLADLFELAQAYDAHLVVDESFAVGILGARGIGGLEHAALMGKHVSQFTGFDRTLASSGAALSASREVCDLVRAAMQQSSEERPLTPATCATTEATINLVETESTARGKLRSSAARVTKELKAMGYRLGGETGVPIIPLIVDDPTLLSKLIHGLFERGVLVAPLIHPGIANPLSVLRLTISALHTEEQVSAMLQAFEDTGKRLGILKG